MSHTHKIRRLLVLVTLTVAVLLPAPLGAAESFQLDFDSMETETSQLQGSTFTLEGGLRPGEAAGSAGSWTVDTVVDASSAASSASAVATSNAGTVSDAGTTATGGGRRTGATQQQETAPSAQPNAATVISSAAPTRFRPSGSAGQDPSPSSSFSPEVPTNAVEFPSSMAFEIPGSDVSVEMTQSQSVDEQTITTASASDGSSTPASAADALALGSMSLTQGGILARLSWMARLKSLYGTIPAFLS